MLSVKIVLRTIVTNIASKPYAAELCYHYFQVWLLVFTSHIHYRRGALFYFLRHGVYSNQRFLILRYCPLLLIVWSSGKWCSHHIGIADVLIPLAFLCSLHQILFHDVYLCCYIICVTLFVTLFCLILFVIMLLHYLRTKCLAL